MVIWIDALNQHYHRVKILDESINSMDSGKVDIFESINEWRAEYIRLALNALKEGLSEIYQAKSSGGYIGTYYDFPSLSYHDNGLPTLRSATGVGPIDYRGCFNSYNGKPLIDENSIHSFSELVSFVRSHEALHKRFIISNKPTTMEFEFDKFNIILGIKDSIERYIHNFNDFSYDETKALAAISPTVAYIFDRNLNIDISVPILFLSFNFDSFQLADGIFIEKIPASQHKSRYKIKSYNTSVHDSVIYSATHALVLKGWFVPNSERILEFNILSNIRGYPIEQIDQFFGALRISSAWDTGYAQVYAIAKGWEAHYTAGLPYLQGITVRMYPNWFEDYYWNMEKIPVISSDSMDEIKIFFNKIKLAKENSLNLALKRLNRCLVRDDEEDAVLDATIALEALLSDGNQEMTHKLAMRVGALSKLDGKVTSNPIQACADIKNIYSYRSAIVHGSKNPDKKRIIKINEEKNSTARALSIDYLKMALRVLLENEKFREPKCIDEELLLGS